MGWKWEKSTMKAEVKGKWVEVSRAEEEYGIGKGREVE